MMLSTYAKQLINRVVLSKEGDITADDMEHLKEEIFATVNKMLNEEYRHTSERWRRRLGPVGPPYFSVNHNIVANGRTVGKYTLTHIDVRLTIDGAGTTRINLSSHVDEDIFNWVVASLRKLRLLEATSTQQEDKPKMVNERMKELAGLNEDIRPTTVGQGKWIDLRDPLFLSNAQLTILIRREIDPQCVKVEWSIPTDNAVAKVHYVRKSGEEMVAEIFFAPDDRGSGNLGFRAYITSITYDKYKKAYGR